LLKQLTLSNLVNIATNILLSLCQTRHVFGVWIILLFFSCDQLEKKETFKIGFSQCVSNDAWRRAMHEEMSRELSFYPELSLEIKDARGNNELQIRQIREFLNEGIDLLVVSPNESDPLTPVVEEAFQSGVPVIIVDRKINSNLYSAYVGGDNYEIGYTAGQYLRNLLDNRGDLLEIWGLKGSSPAKERHRGLMEALEGSGIRIVAELEGEWEKDTARVRMKDYLEQEDHVPFDLIFGHNDVMAIGAYEICRDVGLRHKKFVGVDALPGKFGGIQAITDGVLHASFIYPTGGDKAIEVAKKILFGEVYEKENILQTAAVDSSNVRIMKQQTDKILDQQANIIRQRDMINNQVELYQSQRGLLMIFGITLFVAIASLAYVFKSLKEKQEINKELKYKNQEILEQQEKFLEYSRQAEEVTRYKLEFFTNISHEFRTPLTLIQGPVEELLDRKDTGQFKNDLLLIKKNTLRLLRLVNQLMDFRKIDNGKMQVRANLQPIVPFLEEIMSAFRKTAKDQQVHFKLMCDAPNLQVWIDPSMMDKVMFNLLSNAFKLIPRKGHIHLHVSEDPVRHEVVIKVEDNGPGMDVSELRHIFDRFYQAKPGERKMGTGLGLALSKELVELHRGTITASSDPGENTTFEIRLKLGNVHFDSHELMTDLSENAYLHLDHESFFRDETNVHAVRKDLAEIGPRILVVEDDLEIRSYLKAKLEELYEVLETDNPDTALAMVHDCVPDLITCDLMLKDKNGLDLVRKLKSDPKTSYIPIIAISAMASQEDRLAGIKMGVDDYFTKPFSISLVLERIRVLLEERKKLKEHYLHELPVMEPTARDTHEQTEKKFALAFKALVEENVSNPDFGVQEICSELGLSKGQLYRKTKSALGYSVNDYISKVRLKKARYLLLNDKSAIADIAFQVGFRTGAYFSTAFKMAYGITPSEYRDRAYPEGF
jgi:signal transduction histidine kinase/AraC-like DNA-binding protein